MGDELVINRVINSIRNCYISASNHPLLVFMAFLLFWTHQFFPFLFSLLVHASPVIASTLILLGTLLFYGHANAPEIQREGTSSHHHEIHNLVFGGMGNTELDNNDGRKSVDSRASRKQDAKSESGNQKPVLVNRGAQFDPSKSSDVSRRSSFDPLHSILGHFDDDHKGWDSGSDASTMDNFPMLDQGHLLDEIHNETDDDDDDDDHDDIEVKDDYDDEDEHVVTWTERDQRNLMSMGTLELERNQRLQSLVARQKVIKNMRMAAEKNLANMSPDSRFMDPHFTSARNHQFDGSVSSNMMARRHSVDVPYDLHGAKPDRMGPTFQSGSVQANLPLGYRHRRSDVGIMGHSTHTSDVNVHPNIPRSRRLSQDGDSVRLHRAAVAADDRSNEVKISGENAAGNEDKTSNKSSSSSFCDVTENINDGADDNEEEEFGSVDEPTTQDSKDLQHMQDSGDSDTDTESDTEEAGLTQRLKSWFTGWKA
ncbi:hypothetical protein Hdeb2414_s0019g00540631 [Helianthus debilis subsp. tardiflorus]